MDYDKKDLPGTVNITSLENTSRKNNLNSEFNLNDETGGFNFPVLKYNPKRQTHIHHNYRSHLRIRLGN